MSNRRLIEKYLDASRKRGLVAKPHRFQRITGHEESSPIQRYLTASKRRGLAAVPSRFQRTNVNYQNNSELENELLAFSEVTNFWNQEYDATSILYSINNSSYVPYPKFRPRDLVSPLTYLVLRDLQEPTDFDDYF